MKADKDCQTMQDNIVIFNSIKKTSDKQKIVIESVVANLSKWGKQLGFQLETKTI